ncbi:MAG: right-handed parallel beta-helix repeat-containing protein [Saprospirales bacterium]|nr:right-handed parallel beta-helix repeat-containing protein [Saprospirales bacterium]
MEQAWTNQLSSARLEGWCYIPRGFAGVILDGFTITRAGNNVTDWNNSGLNFAGVAIQGQTNNAEIKNCKLIGNRTGIDINNSNGNNIHNNLINFNRTGMLFRNTTDNTILIGIEITDNWTMGILFIDASGGTNVPVQSALNSSFNNNNISGNWYGQIVDRQEGGSLPTPGTTNMKDFSCNWYGTTTPVVSTLNSSEPGYSAQIPLRMEAQRYLLVGNLISSALLRPILIIYSIWLTVLTIMDLPGFQPAPLSCMGGCPGGVVINTVTEEIFCSLQDAINDPNTLDGHTLEVAPGDYTEAGQIVIDKNLTITGTGTGCGDVVIRPDANTGNSGDARGWWLVQPGKQLNINKLTLDGAGFLVHQAIRDKGYGNFDQICFKNIKYNESGPDYNGVAVAAFGSAASSNVNITNSTFEELGRIGVLYYDTGVDASNFRWKYLHRKGAGDWLDYALDISGGAVVTVSNNTITNNLGGGIFRRLHFCGYFGNYLFWCRYHGNYHWQYDYREYGWDFSRL